MNANCVLIPHEILKSVGNMDSCYTHSLGDYDIGFKMSRMGYRLVSSHEYIGVCEGNENQKNWKNSELSRTERLKLKESPKGSPFKEWWHFLYKNYGLPKALVHSFSPYVKIALGR